MHSWTTFYWANWMAWAPITALFLGRISYGYSVRQFILFNWLIPASFGILWMSVFSGTSLFLEIHENKELVLLLNEKGPDAIVYRLFEHLPFAKVLSGLFLFTVFLSYVTVADSNTGQCLLYQPRVLIPMNQILPNLLNTHVEFLLA